MLAESALRAALYCGNLMQYRKVAFYVKIQTVHRTDRTACYPTMEDTTGLQSLST